MSEVHDYYDEQAEVYRFATAGEALQYLDKVPEDSVIVVEDRSQSDTLAKLLKVFGLR